jgi:hypothetical protein
MISKEKSSDDKTMEPSFAAGNNGSASNVKRPNLVQLIDATGLQIPDDMSKGNGIVGFDGIRASKDMTAENVKFSAVNGYGNDSSSTNLNVSSVQDKQLRQKSSDKSDITTASQIASCGKLAATSNQDVTDKVPTSSEISASISSTPVVNSSTGNATFKLSGQKTSASSGISDMRQSANQGKASSTPNAISSTVPKAGPSRPGMLLIRPASNLVAANTKTEYLALTKYNDVRKGEFAPASKKVAEPSGDEESVNDDDCDVADAAPDMDTNEQYIFAGAGVHLSRSLLDKTKQGKRVNDFHL